MSITKFLKQPVEIQDYDFDFSEYLTYHSDSISTHTATCDAGVTIMATDVTGSVVKVFVSGGVSGQNYKVSVNITTLGGRVKQGDVLVKVREI